MMKGPNQMPESNLPNCGSTTKNTKKRKPPKTRDRESMLEDALTPYVCRCKKFSQRMVRQSAFANAVYCYTITTRLLSGVQ